ncbi:hypothetical protein FHS56_001775 [Thermonema lapsum]|uniref:Uncharacterized protein n=1 Tax=Thermonema lapsum TaxID=28195 RepID=A0A846MSD4_9BACT|nr:hypothetical protein [Thermonema lapsum]
MISAGFKSKIAKISELNKTQNKTYERSKQASWLKQWAKNTLPQKSTLHSALKVKSP